MDWTMVLIVCVVAFVFGLGGYLLGYFVGHDLGFKDGLKFK